MSASPPGRSYLPPEEPDRRVSGLAVISLWMGIFSWVALPLVCAIPAVLLGHKARIEIAKSGEELPGDRLAVIGLWLGYANLAFVALIGLCAAGVFLFAAVGNFLEG
jgi:hypothetical protein